MRFLKNLIVLLFILCFGADAFAPKNKKYATYTIATTYKKLNKDHPYIQPVQPLQAWNIISNENIVYRKLQEVELKADVYYPKLRFMRNSGGFAYPRRRNGYRK